MSQSTRFSRRNILGMAAAGLVNAALPPMASGKSVAQPNIIFILADDLGYADLSCYGRRDYQTPHIDSLASEGLQLFQAYANSAVCSATRCALITGCYQYRFPVGLVEPLSSTNTDLALPVDRPTLPLMFRNLGYRTALIGKWHLGAVPDHGPLKYGYDHFYGIPAGVVDYFTHETVHPAKGRSDLFNDEQRIKQDGYLTDLLTDEAVKEIELNAKAQHPFFMSLHYTAPHWPWEGPLDEESAKSRKSMYHTDGGSLKIYASMVRSLDDGVGKVLQSLAKHGLDRNTIVIFTSDNGGERFSDTWPFIGVKSELLEGGIRVPALIRWPHLIRAKSTSTQVMASMDWFPTLLSAAGGQPSAHYPLDGENLLPVLLGKATAHPRTLYWRYKAYEQLALRDGDWKYLKLNNKEFLFDLAADVRERANLATTKPDLLARMKAQYAEWDRTMLTYPEGSNSHSVKDAGGAADRY